LVDKFYYCLHHPKAVVPELRFDCPNRKPKPGLLMRAAACYGLSPADCWLLGDTEPDMCAGLAAGCRTAWVGSMRCDVCPARRGLEPDVFAENLLAAVGMILEDARCSYYSIARTRLRLHIPRASSRSCGIRWRRIHRITW
jgi:hypothetical protein